jgi:hypothetical protein
MDFKPEHLMNMHNHKNAVEHLKELDTFWIGPDVYLKEKVIVPPLGEMVESNLLISKNQLPDMDINRGSLQSLQWSVRSVLAQSGIETLFSPHDLSDEMVQKLSRGEEVAVPIKIINHGERPIEIDGACMRFFWVDDSKRLRGEDLKSIIGNELVLEGEEGKDWSLGGLNLDPDQEYLKHAYTGEMDTVCVKLPLTNTKLYIPAADEPLRIKSKKELPEVLREIPSNLTLNFKIGETTRVALGPHIVGVINTGAYDEGRHIRSPLIDPGFEGAIRTEITHDLNYIELFIYKK